MSKFDKTNLKFLTGLQVLFLSIGCAIINRPIAAAAIPAQAQDPACYVKKATWYETVLTSRETLSALLGQQAGQGDRRKIWQLAERDFNSIDALDEMTMDRVGQIWQKDWTAGDLNDLAKRYVAATEMAVDLVPRITTGGTRREVPCYGCDAARAARNVRTSADLDAVRRIYYKAFATMRQIILQDADENIRNYRTGTLIIKTAPGAKVKVTQLRHDFLFGTCLASEMWTEPNDYDARKKWLKDFDYLNSKDDYPFIEANRQRYFQLIKDNFNCGVHQNALKWFNVEPAEGDIYYTAAERVTQWCMQNDIKMRGHCIVWGVEPFVPAWQKNMDKENLRRNVERRCKEVVDRFKGRISDWDLNNEMLRSRWYRDRLGDEIIGDMFRWAKQADPNAVLCLNDYNILVGNNQKDLDGYVAQIGDFLKKGYPVGGINCQAHGWNGDTNPGYIRRGLDTLTQFRLPVKISEYVIDCHSDNQDYAARRLEEHFRIFFGHPQVEAILFWGVWEGAHYLPKAAIWKKDFSPTPAALAYRNLVFNKWWTNWQGTADGEGICKVQVFYGRHSIETAGKKIEINFPKSEGKQKNVELGTQKIDAE